MNGLDTNVLVRFLVADDESQSLKARRYIESAPAYINSIVLSEAIRVLEGAYGYQKDAIAGMLEKLLSTHEIQVERADVAVAALEHYRTSPACFTDCLIGLHNAAHGCAETGSFDRRARVVPGFRKL